MPGWIGLAAVAATAGLAAEMLLGAPLHPAELWFAAALLALLAAWIAATDQRTFLIPDAAVAAIAILGAAVRLAGTSNAGGGGQVFAFVVGDALLWGGCFFLLREIHFRRRGFDGIGFGDVKLAAAGAVLNGTAGFAWSLLLASLAALLTAWRGSLQTGKPAEKIPFGAFLAPCCCGIWLVRNLLWV